MINSGGELERATRQLQKEREPEGPGPELSRDVSPDTPAYDRRCARVTEAESALHVELVEAEVLWGRLLAAPRKQLAECTAHLFKVLVMHSQRETLTRRAWGPL